MSSWFYNKVMNWGSFMRHVRLSQYPPHKTSDLRFRLFLGHSVQTLFTSLLFNKTYLFQCSIHCLKKNLTLKFFLTLPTRVSFFNIGEAAVPHNKSMVPLSSPLKLWHFFAPMEPVGSEEAVLLSFVKIADLISLRPCYCFWIKSLVIDMALINHHLFF